MNGAQRPSSRRALRLVVQPVPLSDADLQPETICYRGQTLSIIRHYFEMSSQLGRLPSILGREFFRAKVSHMMVPSFEDQALFLHDVDRAFHRLDEEQRKIVTVVGMYDVSHQEAATMLHCSEGWVSQRFSEAIAALTTIFLDTGLLKRDKPDRKQVQMKGRAMPADIAGLPPKKPCDSVRNTAESRARLRAMRFGPFSAPYRGY